LDRLFVFSGVNDYYSITHSKTVTGTMAFVGTGRTLGSDKWYRFLKFSGFFNLVISRVAMRLVIKNCEVGSSQKTKHGGFNYDYQPQSCVFEHVEFLKQK